MSDSRVDQKQLSQGSSARALDGVAGEDEGRVAVVEGQEVLDRRARVRPQPLVTHVERRPFIMKYINIYVIIIIIIIIICIII